MRDPGLLLLREWNARAIEVILEVFDILVWLMGHRTTKWGTNSLPIFIEAHTPRPAMTFVPPCCMACFDSQTSMVFTRDVEQLSL